MLRQLKQLIPPAHPLRNLWHTAFEAVAEWRAGHPSRRLTVIGVTGTNGKTTTTNLIAAMLRAAGNKVAFASTANFGIGDETWANDTKFTTLGRGGLHRFLKKAADSGCTHAVIEISSHALTQGRAFGTQFDAAALTNLTPEHLDFHGSWEAYRAAKVKLFALLAKSNKPKKVAALPAEDPSFEHFRAAFPAAWSWGLTAGDLQAREIAVSPAGQSFRIVGHGYDFPIQTRLLAEFNVKNILAACGVALQLGVPVAAIQSALRMQEAVPGRLEPVDAGQPFRVIVDFAHTVEALEQVIQTFRPITAGKIWVLYGACGDRDRSLRAPRGAVLDRLADEVVITTDDPYFEDPQQTMDDVVAGITDKKEGAGLCVELDRRAAMRHTLANAKPGDTVLLCGKGCEPITVWGSEKRPWDDRVVARELLAELGYRS